MCGKYSCDTFMCGVLWRVPHSICCCSSCVYSKHSMRDVVTNCIKAICYSFLETTITAIPSPFLADGVPNDDVSACLVCMYGKSLFDCAHPSVLTSPLWQFLIRSFAYSLYLFMLFIYHCSWPTENILIFSSGHDFQIPFLYVFIGVMKFKHIHSWHILKYMFLGDKSTFVVVTHKSNKCCVKLEVAYMTK